MVKRNSDVLPEFVYFTKGDNPKLLLHCGTHGDEFTSIALVTEAVNKYKDILPNFIFVPRVPPSAVNQTTRCNKNNLDLNRVFTNETNDMEVRVNINILQKYKFDLMVTFHEDLETDEYYVYEEGYKSKISKRIFEHHNFLVKNSIKLLNGVDDPSDPHLNFEFIEGYRQFLSKEDDVNNGTVTGWLLSEKRVDDTITVETPGKISFDKKKLIIDSFFEKVILNTQ